MAVSSLGTHPLLEALAGGAGAGKSWQESIAPALPDERELDSLPDADSGFEVLDADADQRLCLTAAARGHSFIITGAPGTGKRQTIANLIAHFLGKGQMVLCVSPKQARLQEIGERLRQIGLGDWCVRAGDKPKPSAPRNSAPSSVELERLKECRARLAGYLESLHAVRAPLQRSAWSVLCELAERHDVPALPLGLPLRRKDAEGSDSQVVVEEITPTWLDESRQALQRLQQLWHIRAQKDFPWWGLRAERYNQQLRDEMIGLIDRARKQLDRLLESARKYGEQLGGGGSIGQLLKLGEHLEGKPANIPAAWLQEPDLARLNQDVERCADQYQRLGEARAPLTERYGAALWKLPEGTAAAVDQAWRQAAPLLAPGDDAGAGLLTHQQQLRGWAADTQKRIPGWLADARILEKWVAIPLPAGAGPSKGEAGSDPSVHGLRQLLRLANLCQTENPPERPWVHNPEALTQARQLIAADRPAFTSYRERRGKLLETYNENFFDLELERMAAGFSGPYLSFWRLFNSQYRRDKRAIARRSRTEMLPPTAAADMIEAHALMVEKGRLEAEGPRRQPVLGRYEKGLDTDFDAAERGTRVAAEALELVHGLGAHSLPARLLDVLCAGAPAPEKVRAAAKRLHDSLSAWLHATHELQAYLPADAMPGTGQALEPSALSALNEYARRLQTGLNQFGSLTDPVLSKAPAPPPDAVTLVADLKRADEVRTFEASQETEAGAWGQRLGAAFQGLGTDWNALRKTITWLRRFRELSKSAERNQAPPRLSEAVIAGASPSPRDLRHALEQYEQALHGLEHRFEPPEPLFEGKRLAEHPPEVVKQRLAVLRERVADLAARVDWQNLPRRFAHLGLGAFWEHLLAHPPQAEQLWPLFLKSFWHAWWQAVAQTDPNLANFRAEDQDRLVAEFGDLDRRWLQANAARIPQSAKSPCILATFQELDALPAAPSSFDVVIVDDGAQVGVDDAWSALGRVRQAIVVGDDQQPPGFAIERTEGGFEMAPASESILRRCSTAGLTRLRLRYHRRGEGSLFAFVNAQLYDGELVAFPPADPANAATVDLVQVKGGVADPTGANPREADAVADLVVAHLRSRPEQSLGVLTMTAAQARLIEDQVEKRLLKQPALQKLFAFRPRGDEGAATVPGQNGVLIKTVDQAVGEERDVLIVSLGFSPGAKGQPPADLGLLALDHGERWLQPALTGARRHLTLVASLTSKQLEIKGKPMPALVFLRELLEYAAKPPAAAATDGDVHAIAGQVAKELQRQGITAMGPLGLGSQPIELAIADPLSPGRFVLAIEFDGPAYRAAASVRDRDRLRRETLTQLGWTVHRLWTPAWIFQREEEELQRLLRTAKDALQRATAAKKPTPATPGKAASRSTDPGAKALSR